MVASLGSAQEWTVASTADFYCLASTADGGRLFGLGGNIYTSTNFGNTWSLTGAPFGYYNSVACSADGSTIIASLGNGAGLYVSTNFGVAWRLAFSSSNWWSSVACSSDGRSMAATSYYPGAYPGAVYISTNAGADWTLTSAPNGGWQHVQWSGALAMSGDGSRLAVATSSVEVSTNFGLTWTATYSSGPPMGAPLFFVASSGAGTTLIAISISGWPEYGPGFISTSLDWGATWRPVGSLTNYLDGNGFSPAGFCAACSADGVTLAAIETSSTHGVNHLLLSTNSGTSWSITDLPWSTNNCSIVSSADGSRLAAAFFGPGRVYVRGAIPVPRLMILSGPGSLQLSWLLPSEPFVLEESSDLPAWSHVAVTPTLNYTNLHYEVNLPAPIAPRFYRLASQ